MDQDLQDDFDDDLDLDDLPANALNELEHRALQSTQRGATSRSIAYGRLAVESHQVHEYVQHGRKEQYIQPPGLETGYIEPPSSDYGFDDEDVIDLDAHPAFTEQCYAKPVHKLLDEATQREQWRQQRYGAPPLQGQRDVQQFQLAAENSYALEPYTRDQLEQDVANEELLGKKEAISEAPQFDVTLLQARIKELEDERITLQKSAEDAKSAALSKSGEISIVRANHEKAVKEYEHRVAVMLHLHAEEVAKQSAELDSARKDREKVETNNRFLEHDLAQEAQKAKQKRPLKDGNGNIGKTKTATEDSPVTTPKKSKPLPLRDGFNDEEVVVVSPSKPKELSKPSTPRAAAKRKRPAIEKSPSQPLPLRLRERPLDTEDLWSTETGNPDLLLQPKENARDEKFHFINKILSHQSHPSHDKTIEAMTKYVFPSDASKSFSSMIYDSLWEMPRENDIEQFRLSFCESLTLLWSRCVDEKYHDPLYELMELLQYILLISPLTLSTALIPKLVPLCLATADLVTLPTVQAFRDPSINQPPSEALTQRIDTLAYLDLLHLIALKCTTRKNDLANFWVAMKLDNVLMMLHRAQPLAEITRMLELLATSILTTSFGPILPTNTTSTCTASLLQQPKNESSMIDRLTVLLFETPIVPPSEVPYTQMEILCLRRSVLDLLTLLCHTNHGGHIIAIHRLAIGRLVRFIHDTVVSMYAYRPATHALTVSLVNVSVKLLAHLTSVHGSVVDMRARLNAVPGGSYRHLVGLSRVAFGESGSGGGTAGKVLSVLEAGIDPDLAEMARRMLDEHLSPEEGDAVMEVFSSAGG